MKLLVYVLNQPEKLDEVLAGYVEVGITGATVIDSVGMGAILSRDVPLFAAFQSLLRESRSANKTLVSLVENDAMVDNAVRIIESVCGPLDERGAGVLFTVPVDHARGLRKPEAGDAV